MGWELNLDEPRKYYANKMFPLIITINRGSSYVKTMQNVECFFIPSRTSHAQLTFTKKQQCPETKEPILISSCIICRNLLQLGLVSIQLGRMLSQGKQRIKYLWRGSTLIAEWVLCPKWKWSRPRTPNGNILCMPLSLRNLYTLLILQLTDLF